MSAGQTIRLADVRIDAAVATLDNLLWRGVNDCGGAHAAALRNAAFFNPAVKEIAVVSAEGRMVCGSSGIIPDLRMVVTPARGEAMEGVTIDVVRVGDGQAMVRVLRRDVSGVGLAALIPASLFGTVASQRTAGLNPFIRLASRDDMTIHEQGQPPVAGAPEFEASERSLRYGLTATASLPLSALLGETQRLKEQATALGAAVFATILVLTVFLRRRDDPVLEFERAIEANEFVPYYQPVVDIRTGRLRGAEVLVRWRKPDGSLVLPSAFIPFAESSGLIVPMMRALMRRTCEEVGETIGRRPEIRIGFNLAAPHFADDRIISDVRAIFENSPIPLKQIIFEVTERQPLHNLVGARRTIAGLQELGCSVAIDDVGTGHGGLSYILKLGADTIKIDKLFIDSIGTEHHSTTILETLVDLARSMRMGVVAEGVENFEQVEKLRELGILAAQGHVFSPPLPGSSFVQLVEALVPLSSDDDQTAQGDYGQLLRRTQAA